MTVRLRLLALCAALAGPCLGAGCAHEGRDQRFGPRVVGARDVARHPAGSPQRVLFEVVRAIEYGDHARAATYLAPDLHITGARLAGRFSPVPPEVLGIPHIDAEYIDGAMARFRVTFSTARARIGMRRRAGTWSVSSAKLLRR